MKRVLREVGAGVGLVLLWACAAAWVIGIVILVNSNY